MLRKDVERTLETGPDVARPGERQIDVDKQRKWLGFGRQDLLHSASMTEPSSGSARSVYNGAGRVDVPIK